ncbi:Myo-inositol transporter 1 OS=Schizosaccharomyces pombe (strain 972 / ATCC 24843) GN=itr1 PE=3 SV=1 [Rhizoctonia solani AG-1 IB]|uniref:Myo-inositol transporter 1 n=2 Tax=Thanatephorus cucumeris (strain AG1-IB / isolate 7/3/14) TaxID=1108050 RepID=A0A0B7FPV7_THACB|nr:Myo-inositol transporter 1 OS=Schizosaccharomyces pombe (strain 972 / ATCC 24843) GN=itr1 PE=3 SV=1 [Rhizoctonia solani AG-1 IB]
MSILNFWPRLRALAYKNGYVKLPTQHNESIDDAVAEIMRDQETGEISEAAVRAEGEEKVTFFVWLLVFASSISGLLFGYDTGVISGTLVTIGSDLGPEQLSNTQKELITSATTLGALLGGLAAGMISDFVGRKPVLAAANVVFIGGAIAQAVCHTVAAMIGGRFLIGIGVGLAACMAPLFIAELSPTKLRGRLVTVNVVFITGGQVIAYGIGAAFESSPGGWRWMVGLGAVPAALQLAMLPFMPESPRILVRRGHLEQAQKNMAKIYAHATPEQVSQKVKVLRASVQESIDIQNSTTFLQRFKSILTVPVNRRALIVACGLQGFQQLCGFNTLVYYSATLFKSIGFDKPTAVGLIIAGTNFIFTMVALKYIDIVGRRKIMLFTPPGMIFGLVLASISFYYLTKSTGGVLVDGAKYPKTWSSLVLFSMVFYVASYATGLGNVPWQQSELFALDVRGIGASIATSANWAANLVIGATYLSLMHAITPSGAFGFYAGLCLLGWLFCIFCYPETAGLSLEEVKLIFRNDFGIKASERMRAAKRELRERGDEPGSP